MAKNETKYQLQSHMKKGPELMEFSESHDTIETVTILQFVLHDKSNEKFANHFYDKIPVAKTSYD
ncbi:hypothetical protein T03_13196 [Trichinella britovi]|uniref:Uncharacterized protein n=2 Tax=Trichinella TaxID=6333 RepID=A0A0V1CRN3_TRIBR|nr:hypothetical protein T05_3806 [Trichinella murrelli]KRY51853.1 hypothetical protein T03_13196 [Trichinella britovi]